MGHVTDMTGMLEQVNWCSHNIIKNILFEAKLQHDWDDQTCAEEMCCTCTFKEDFIIQS